MAAMRLRGTTVLAAATVMASLGLVSACGQGDAPGSHREAGQSSSQGVARGAWVDQPVSFEIGGLTVYATYRHLVRPASAGPARPGPAVLLIAGSGPTDRNGNTPLLPGPVNTLQAIADWLSADGVASLRYDKLGSGRTGLGPYASRPGTIGIGPFEQEAAAALRFLARQPGVDRDRLGVIGHSEGALFALLLAVGASGPTPPIHALGLLEPLGVRYLDAIGYQVDSQIAASQRTGQISPEQASTAKHALATAITDLRATGTVPPDLPPVLSAVFSPATRAVPVPGRPLRSSPAGRPPLPGPARPRHLQQGRCPGDLRRSPPSAVRAGPSTGRHRFRTADGRGSHPEAGPSRHGRQRRSVAALLTATAASPA